MILVEDVIKLVNQCRSRARKAGYTKAAQYERLCMELIGKPQPETLEDTNHFHVEMDFYRTRRR
jgi:hypothetical protein